MCTYAGAAYAAMCSNFDELANGLYGFLCLLCKLACGREYEHLRPATEYLR